MIDQLHPLISVNRQCQLLALPRSTRYHQPNPVPDKTLNVMRQIDELYIMQSFCKRLAGEPLPLEDEVR